MERGRSFVQPLECAVVVRGVIDFAAGADDDTLRAGAAEARRGMDVFLVVTGGVPWQPPFAVLKDRSVVRESELLAVFDSFERGSDIDIAPIDDPPVLVADSLL